MFLMEDNKVEKWVTFPIKLKNYFGRKKCEARSSIVHIAQFFPETMPPFCAIWQNEKKFIFFVNRGLTNASICGIV